MDVRPAKLLQAVVVGAIGAPDFAVTATLAKFRRDSVSRGTSPKQLDKPLDRFQAIQAVVAPQQVFFDHG